MRSLDKVKQTKERPAFSWPFYYLWYIMNSGGIDMEIYIILLTAALFSAPVYIPELYFLSWIAFIPLIYLSYNEDYNHSFITAFLVGLLSSLFSFYWVYQPLSLQLNLPLSLIFLILSIFFIISALPIAVWTVINKFLQPRHSFSPFIAALSWGSLEYLRYRYININPFNYIAYNQTGFNSLTQFSAVGGIFLVAFLAVLLGGYLVKIYLKPSFKRAVPLVIILILIIVFPYIYYGNTGEDAIYKDVEIINSQQSAEEDMFTRVRENTKKIADLINQSSSSYVFAPQNALSFDLIRNNYYRNILYENIRDNFESKYIQLGSRAGTGENYNTELKDSLFLLNNKLEIVNRYSRRKNIFDLNNLLYQDRISSFLSSYLELDIGNVSEDKIDVFELNDLKYINLLSEELYKPLEGNVSAKDFNLILNSADESNIDAQAFKNYSWSAAVLRAAENRVSVLRAAKNGYNGYIDPAGKEKLKKLSPQGILESSVLLKKSGSYYQSNSYFVANIMLILTGLISLIKLIFLVKEKRFSND